MFYIDWYSNKEVKNQKILIVLNFTLWSSLTLISLKRYIKKHFLSFKWTISSSYIYFFNIVKWVLYNVIKMHDECNIIRHVGIE